MRGRRLVLPCLVRKILDLVGRHRLSAAVRCGGRDVRGRHTCGMLLCLALTRRFFLSGLGSQRRALFALGYLLFLNFSHDIVGGQTDGKHHRNHKTDHQKNHRNHLAERQNHQGSEKSAKQTAADKILRAVGPHLTELQHLISLVRDHRNSKGKQYHRQKRHPCLHRDATARIAVFALTILVIILGLKADVEQNVQNANVAHRERHQKRRNAEQTAEKPLYGITDNACAVIHAEQLHGHKANRQYQCKHHQNIGESTGKRASLGRVFFLGWLLLLPFLLRHFLRLTSILLFIFGRRGVCGVSSLFFRRFRHKRNTSKAYIPLSLGKTLIMDMLPLRRSYRTYTSTFYIISQSKTTFKQFSNILIF